MSKLRMALLTLALTFLVLFSFQNCAESISWEEGEENYSSFSLALQDHKDRDHWTEALAKVKVESTAEDLIADRRLLGAMLESIFGPSFLSLDQGRTQTNASEFGNPCSIYEDYWVRGAKGNERADARNTCAAQDSSRYFGAPVIPKPSVLRQRNIANVCHSLVTNNTTLNYAVAQIGSGNPQPTSANVRKAFHLFYRNKPAPGEPLIQSLQIMMPGKGTLRKDWAPVLYTICISSGWQIL